MGGSWILARFAALFEKPWSKSEASNLILVAMLEKEGHGMGAKL
jgi:hypothetical protein